MQAGRTRETHLTTAEPHGHDTEVMAVREELGLYLRRSGHGVEQSTVVTVGGGAACRGQRLEMKRWRTRKKQRGLAALLSVLAASFLR